MQQRKTVLNDFSLEITGKDSDSVAEAASYIPQGSRINVTFLGNEDLAMRVNAAKAVKDAGFIPVPHIAARRVTSVDEYREILSTLQNEGLSEVLYLIAGDPAEPMGPFEGALNLMEAVNLEEFGVREVGISGYPEGHPNIKDEVLESAFMAKTAVLEAQGIKCFVITQFSFDIDAVLEWIRWARSKGFSGDIRVGTPGPAGIRRLVKYANRFGIKSSAGIVQKYGFSLANLMGTAGPDKFLRELNAAVLSEESLGEVGLHFYTFGGLEATASWVQEFSAKEGM